MQSNLIQVFAEWEVGENMLWERPEFSHAFPSACTLHKVGRAYSNAALKDKHQSIIVAGYKGFT